MTTPYYKPSGRFTFNFFLLYVLLMLVSIPVLSFAYTYLIHYIPFIYANVIITVCCGLALGYIVSLAVKKGKARNPAIVAILTIVAACVLYYVQWSVYIPLVVSEVYGFSMTFGERLWETLYYFIYPDETFEAAMIINEYGAWTLNEVEITGVFLLIIWIAEFIIIAVAAVVISRSQAVHPYCEEADGWYAAGETVDIDIPADLDAMKAELESGDFTGLIQHALNGFNDEDNYMRLTFHKPPESISSEPYYMNIDKCTVEKTGKGKRQKSKVKAGNYLQFIMIDAKSADEIIENAVAAGSAAVPDDSIDSGNIYDSGNGMSMDAAAPDITGSVESPEDE